MKKKNSFWLALALFFLLVFVTGSSGCKPEVVERYIPDSLYPFFNFNIGSWWLYQNDSTLQLDSCYVIVNDHTYSEWEDEEENIVYHNDAIHTTLNSTAFPPVINFVYGRNSFRTRGLINYGFTPYCFADPSYLGVDSGTELEFVEVFDSIQFGTEKFFEVYHMKDALTRASSPWNNPIHFYYKKNVGIVHWSHENLDTCWTLLSYHTQ